MDGVPRVELLAVVAWREPEREAAVRGNRGVAGGNHDVLDVRVAVLDDRAAGGAAPFDIERVHALADERSFDPRPLETLEHHAVERAVSAHLNRAGARAERVQDRGEDAVALLPVRAGDVEWHSRLLTVRGPAFHLDIGFRR